MSVSITREQPGKSDSVMTEEDFEIRQKPIDELPGPGDIYPYIKRIKEYAKENGLERDDPYYLPKLRAAFPKFSETYPSFFGMIVGERDLSMLPVMLNRIEQIKRGDTTHKEAVTRMSGELLKRFIEPKT